MLPQLFGEWMPPDDVEPIFERARTMTAAEIMTPRVFTVSEEDSLGAVLRLMLKHGVHRIPVVKDGVPSGVVARRDLLRIVSQC